MTISIDVLQLSPPERLLWDYGVTAPEHIDLEAIARNHGAEVRYRALEGSEARLVTFGDRAVISICNDRSEGRRRFSLGHELAHWLCDRKSGAFLCAKDDIGPQNAEAKSVEAKANAYASQLVLPTYLVDSWLGGHPISLDVADKMAKAFHTSLTAAAIKAVKRTSAQLCLACHSQTALIWHQRSRTFPQEFFVLSELHQDTDAFRMVFGGLSGMSRSKKEPGNRWLSGRDAYRVEAVSQSLKLPDGSVLTMLSIA